MRERVQAKMVEILGETMITKVHFMKDPGYLTQMRLSGTKKTSYGYVISWKEGINKGSAYKKVMIQSVYKGRDGTLRGNFKKGKVKLDNVLIRPECVPDIVEALAKIYEEHVGESLLGQEMNQTPAGRTVKSAKDEELERALKNMSDFK